MHAAVFYISQPSNSGWQECGSEGTSAGKNENEGKQQEDTMNEQRRTNTCVS